MGAIVALVSFHSYAYISMKQLKLGAFVTLIVIIVLLAVSTIIDRVAGVNFSTSVIFSSIPFLILWFILGLLSLVYLITQRMSLIRPAALVHLSFAIILIGALFTWFMGKSGSVHLRIGSAVDNYYSKESQLTPLPFELELRSFSILYYEGTSTPLDFVSHIKITDNRSGKIINKDISMNSNATYGGYRLLQKGYDSDGCGSQLGVTYDPWGWSITLGGYVLLAISILWLTLHPKSRFRVLLCNPIFKRGLSIVLFVCTSLLTYATDTPKSIPYSLAKKLGHLHILHNNRIAPLQTFAYDFTLKLYGKASYKRLSPEQVVAGWLFFGDSWIRQPIIKLKSEKVKQALGITSDYASLSDFYTETNTYKLAELSMNSVKGNRPISTNREIVEVEEKLNIIKGLTSGSLLKLFPIEVGPLQIEWFSPISQLPENIDNDDWLMARKSFDYLNELVVSKQYQQAEMVINKIGRYQQQKAKNMLPSPLKFKFELLYNQISSTKVLPIILLTGGIFFFFKSIRSLALKKQLGFFDRFFRIVVSSSILIFISVELLLRGLICGQIPLSNGFETMQFMAWCSLTIAITMNRKHLMILPLGMLASGLAMLVSIMGQSNPQITPLVPALNSPLLSIHVMVIMLAYTLFAMIMLNGISALAINLLDRIKTKDLIETLAVLSQVMLYPAVALLTIGIFIGAIWANYSWGRYWGWDPKEIWALITLLIYAIALHPKSLKPFSNPIFFHFYVSIAFLSVVTTYFGVNFFFGGLHSYAN